jgi:hypothetical protein
MSEESDLSDTTFALLGAALGILRLASCNLEGICRRLEHGLAGPDEVRQASALLNVQYESLWHLADTMEESRDCERRNRERLRVRTSAWT